MQSNPEFENKWRVVAGLGSGVSVLEKSLPLTPGTDSMA